MPVADDDYKNSLKRKQFELLLRQNDAANTIGLGGGGGAIGSVAGRVAAPVARGLVSSAANFVRGFFGSGASNASRGVVVKTAIPMPPVPRNLPAVIPRIAIRTNAVGRPAPRGISTGTKIAAGVAVAGTAGLVAQGINDANRSGTTPTSKPTSKPTSVATKKKDFAYFTAEAKKKGKTGKGVSNYAYTMLKDYKMRTGTSGLTGARISGMKTK